MSDVKDAICRGSFRLGTACCRCDRCLKYILTALLRDDRQLCKDIEVCIIRVTNLDRDIFDAIEAEARHFKWGE